MTIKDCAKIAALLLNVSDVFSEAERLENERSEEGKELISLLVQCANIAIAELATDYFNLVKSEKILCENKELKFEDLSRKIIDVRGVIMGGKSVPFKEFAWGLKLEKEGEAEIEYAYAPNKAALEDETEFMKNLPSEECVAYGIAREYCLINGMISEASLFDSKFLSLANHKNLKNPSKKLPIRSWYF